MRSAGVRRRCARAGRWISDRRPDRTCSASSLVTGRKTHSCANHSIDSPPEKSTRRIFVTCRRCIDIEDRHHRSADSQQWGSGTPITTATPRSHLVGMQLARVVPAFTSSVPTTTMCSARVLRTPVPGRRMLYLRRYHPATRSTETPLTQSCTSLPISAVIRISSRLTSSCPTAACLHRQSRDSITRPNTRAVGPQPVNVG